MGNRDDPFFGGLDRRYRGPGTERSVARADKCASKKNRRFDIRSGRGARDLRLQPANSSNAIPPTAFLLSDSGSFQSSAENRLSWKFYAAKTGRHLMCR